MTTLPPPRPSARTGPLGRKHDRLAAAVMGISISDTGWVAARVPARQRLTDDALRETGPQGLSGKLRLDPLSMAPPHRLSASYCLPSLKLQIR